MLPSWALFLKPFTERCLRAAGLLIKPDGLADSWLDSWLTDPPPIYSHQYVDEPEAISFRKSTSLHILRKLNFYGWPSLEKAQMPKSVSRGTRVVEFSAGGPWTSAVLLVWAKRTANCRPFIIWMERGEGSDDRHQQVREYFCPVSTSPSRWLGSHL